MIGEREVSGLRGGGGRERERVGGRCWMGVGGSRGCREWKGFPSVRTASVQCVKSAEQTDTLSKSVVPPPPAPPPLPAAGAGAAAPGLLIPLRLKLTLMLSK